jgi:hypothetical protein
VPIVTYVFSLSEKLEVFCTIFKERNFCKVQMYNNCNLKIK